MAQKTYGAIMPYERWIVVGTDFSDESHAALEHALRLAVDSGARIALVHAYEEVPGTDAVEDPTQRLLDCVAREIAGSGASRRGIQIDAVVRRGRPWDKILNVASEYGADLVVLGGSGQRGLPLGSVTTRVLERSKRCVLVARRDITLNHE
jgi:nucleotide-binding universal stress UspA family protein